jgi:RNA polymerase-binding transcription factor DksA
VKPAEDGDRLAPGRVYVAPPDRHVLVNPDGTLSLTKTQRVRHVRPSADVLFPSLAASCGGRGVAVVLTGGDANGAAGVRVVKQAGGFVVAQDEATSRHFAMPRAAIETGCVDRVLPVGEIGPALDRLARADRGTADDCAPGLTGSLSGPGRPGTTGRPVPPATLASEATMTERDFPTYRRRLRELVVRLTGDVSELEAEALHPAGGTDGPTADTDQNDPGARGAEGEVALAVLGTEGQVLAEARAALDRLDRGTFGRCERCGKPIAGSRLDALPYVRHCIRCARAAESGGA